MRASHKTVVYWHSHAGAPPAKNMRWQRYSHGPARDPEL